MAMLTRLKRMLIPGARRREVKARAVAAAAAAALSDHKPSFWAALRRDDAAGVATLWARHPDLREVKLPLAATWLHIAARDAGLDVVEWFVRECGYAVDQPCTDGNPETPLHYAASKGRTRVVNWLLDHGAAVNAHDNYGRTPLMYAAMEGADDTVELLLARGADPGVSYGEARETAESMARLRKHTAVAETIRLAASRPA